MFGEGQIANIAEHIPADAKILMTYGGGSIKKNGVYQQVQEALKALKAFTVYEFSGIEPNPRYETLMEAVEFARREKIDFLLAVGGGSVIDGTKFIAAAIPFEGEPWDILEKQAEINSAIPLASVLTLPATGSEMNAAAVVTREATEQKLAFINPLLYPQFSVLDPCTTFSLPPKQVANGVVDAFTHVMEQYLTYANQSPLNDRFAESILQTLIEVGPTTLAEPQNYDARATFMWAATMALNGIIGQGVAHDWATHMIGHELTVQHGLDHAQTLAIVLPAVMDNQQHHKKDKILQYVERVWGITEGDDASRIQQAIAKTREFFTRMGVNTYLSDYEIGADVIEKVVAGLERRGAIQFGEHSAIDADAVREILLLSLKND